MRKMARTSVHVLVGMALVLQPVAAVDHRAAVKRFVTTSYPFERKVDRKYAVRGIEDVTRELGVNLVSSQTILSFPKKAGAPISHALAVVDSQNTVRLLHDLASINSLFDIVPRELAPGQVARLTAETFLRVFYFDGYRNHGYEFGVNVVRRPEDIPGLKELSGAEGIRPPAFEEDCGGYHLTVYSWTPAGGALTRHRVSVIGNQVSNYDVETLQRWMGAHGPAH